MVLLLGGMVLSLLHLVGAARSSMWWFHLKGRFWLMGITLENLSREKNREAVWLSSK